MKMPFSREQFFSVFETYNMEVYPLQWVFIILGLMSIFLLFRGRRNYLHGWILIFFWFWSGIFYHLIFFTSINPTAYFFATLFVIQAWIFFRWIRKKKPVFNFEYDLQHLLGIFLMLLGIIIYPIIGLSLETSVTKIISLGLPCPTTIFTFGLLLFVKGKIPVYVLIIPNIWALIGTMAAINFNVYQDFSLLMAAVLANFYFLRPRKGFHIPNTFQK